MIILLFGPQGSGKGTQGELLSKALNLPLVGAGLLLRHEIASGSELGRSIASYIDPGNLVPPELISEMLAKRLRLPDTQVGAIIDGYPRDERQLQLMYDYLSPDLIVFLELDDETSVQRLAQRWSCPEGHVYNAVTHPPKVTGVCDTDGLTLTQRADETREAILKRLSIYHRDTEPLLSEMESRGIRVIRVDARRDIQEVFNDILLRIQA